MRTGGIEARTSALFRGKEVESVRRMLGLSQALFAQFLGVSLHAVRAWENGGKTPSAWYAGS